MAEPDAVYLNEKFEPVPRAQATLVKVTYPNGRVVFGRPVEDKPKGAGTRKKSINEALRDAYWAQKASRGRGRGREDYYNGRPGDIQFLGKVAEKGDAPGHEFRGNQWSSGTGAKDLGNNSKGAMAWGEDNYKGWTESLSDSERSAITGYTHKGDRAINGQLRKGNVRPAVQEQIDQIDAALERSTIPESVVVYRNVGQTFLGDTPPEDAVGQVFRDKAFISTSLQEFRLEHDEDIQLKIEVPAGSRGAYIAGVSGWPRETEVLLPRGTAIELTGYTKLFGTHYFTAQVVE